MPRTKSRRLPSTPAALALLLGTAFTAGCPDHETTVREKPDPRNGPGTEVNQSPPTRPPLVDGGPDCELKLAFRDSGATHDGKPYTDYQKLGLTNNAELLGTSGGPSPADQLGYGGLTYISDSPYARGVGYFKKTEVDVTVDTPCKLVKVERTMTKLADHTAPNPLPDGPDPVKVTSIDMRSDQYWVVTDAPGILKSTAMPGVKAGDLAKEAKNLTFHKKYKVTSTAKRVDESTLTKDLEYDVLIKTDNVGDIISNPQ